jgi:hypothetical protein
MADIDDAPAQDGPEAMPLPHLRFLKVLVTALAGTMIIGLITLITLIVIRFPSSTGSDAALLPSLPASITLPKGETVAAVTFGRGWVAVVTKRDEILVYDTKDGTLRQRMQIELSN